MRQNTPFRGISLHNSMIERPDHIALALCAFLYFQAESFHPMT